MSDELTQTERRALQCLDEVWLTAREAGVPIPMLRHLRSRNLVAYRAPDGTAGVLRVGEWALTDEGYTALRRGGLPGGSPTDD